MFLLPIGDEPNPRGLPYVTYALIAANVLVYLFISLPLSNMGVNQADPAFAQYYALFHARMPEVSRSALAETMSAYDLYTFKHGFLPGAPSVGDLFYSLFLHGGLAHLLGNMLFLWIFGDNVEARLGRFAYLLVYLGTGVVATLVFAWFAAGAMTPLVGASGAISGVLGCYFVWFRENRVRVLAWIIFYLDVWRVPARFVLGVYLIVDNLLPFILNGDKSGIAHGAHIGGFVAGVLLAAVWPGRAGSASPALHEPLGARFARLVQARDLRGAAELYAQLSLVEREQLDDADVLALARELGDHGQPDVALAIAQRFIGTRQGSPHLAEAHLHAGILQLEKRGQPAAAREHFLSALDLRPPHEIEAAAKHGLLLADRVLHERYSPN